MLPTTFFLVGLPTLALAATGSPNHARSLGRHRHQHLQRQDAATPAATSASASDAATATGSSSSSSIVPIPVATPTGLPDYAAPDRPDWIVYQDKPWYTLDPTIQDHVRLHAYLSMASYGDYATLCPAVFTQGFTLLEQFETGAGQRGFVAQVPEMVKIVIVFQGTEQYDKVDWTPTSISDLVPDCQGCTVSKHIFDLYMSAKVATYDWKIAKEAVVSSGLLFSITGHGDGGCVAILAALDLGARNLTHYSHNQGAPRCFNLAAVKRYDDMYPMIAGQSSVANDDAIVHLNPNSEDFVHVGAKLHLTGNLTQWMYASWGWNENTTNLGDGSSSTDHDYYFAQKGSCGPPGGNKGF